MGDGDPRRSVFAHVVADKAGLYRAVMAAFVAAKQRFMVHLRPDDVLDALWPAHPDADLPAVSAALAQLVDWGNLRADPDTSRVTTVEEFNRARFLYQLTTEGQAAEQALAAFDEALGRRGELQAVALADIRAQLGALAAVADRQRPDPAKAHQLLRDLAAVFDGLAANAQVFMGGLQRTIDLHDADVDAYLAYKDRLIGYLERFVEELVVASAAIAERLVRLDGRIDPLLRLAAAREADDAAPGDEQEAEQARLTAWRGRWSGLRGWFVGEPRRPAQAELLRAAARRAITALLGLIGTLNERRAGRSDRAADFRALARWFAQAPGDDDAHRLWRAAFGLAPARHLTVDADTVDARSQRPLAPSTPWAEAPPTHISPRLRAPARTSAGASPTGSVTARGRRPCWPPPSPPRPSRPTSPAAAC